MCLFISISLSENSQCVSYINTPCEIFDFFLSEPLACNYTYNQTYGNFKSPFYPEYYPDNALCYYHLKTIPGKAFRINFNLFQLQQSPGCVNDSLKMYENGTLKTTLCGPYSRGLTSSDNNVLLVFKSDGSITDRGFYGYFNVTDKRKYSRTSNNLKRIDTMKNIT